MKISANKIASIVVSAVLCVGAVVGNVIAFNAKGTINAFFEGGKADSGVGETATKELAASDKLCTEIEEESITLFKNNGVLPLEKGQKLNVFGYGATDQGFLLKGVGSGSSTISEQKKITLLDALRGTARDYDVTENINETATEADKAAWAEENLSGFEINEGLISKYTDWASKNSNSVRPTSPNSSSVYRLAEPGADTITDEDLTAAYDNYGDVALYVISRDGGENVGEIPAGYLDVSTAEKEMLQRLKQKGFKVVVILNTTNTMHLGFLDELDIDACINVGLTGQSGARAIPSVLNGTVNPSGKFTDITIMSGTVASQYDPTYANRAASGYIHYVDDIYYGYKWFETANVEGYFEANGTSYDEVVAYPFGYGLSYTQFEQKIAQVTYKNSKGEDVALGEDTNLSQLDASTEITVTVEVKNVGKVPGKDVVQIYYTPEYHSGSIEKASVNLVGFGKTEELKPEDTQLIPVTFTLYDMASYDCYDKDGDGFKGYELEQGNYEIKLMTDSHTLVESVKCKANSTMQIKEDPVTKETVSNHFTGADAYAGLGTDGAEAGVDQTWLSREDFAGTFPRTQSRGATNTAVVNNAANYLNDAPYASEAKPTTDEKNGLYLWTLEDGTPASLNDLTGDSNAKIARNDDLIAELAQSYDSETWEKLLNQLSSAEIKALVEQGGFRRKATPTVGLRELYDYDGPAGYNTNSKNGNSSGVWTAFTSEALMGCSWSQNLMFALGRSMGAEANKSGVNGWYAPGVNLHRSAYNARNFEYYSEDGVLSGYLAAQVIAGAKTNGLNCYIKHFACSEEGPNPGGVNTWITEQNLRENYLKPFEIAVKGVDVEIIKLDDNGEVTDTKVMHIGANSIMTAFNRVGASWAGANYAMNVQVLRGEWGFKGSLLTDWTGGTANRGGMNVQQGIRAGNDLWLDPYYGSRSFDVNNTIDVYCGRVSVHNILYTVVDTINCYNEVNKLTMAVSEGGEGYTLDSYQTTLNDSLKGSIPDILTPLLVCLDCVLVIGLGVWIFFAWKPKKNKSEE